MKPGKTGINRVFAATGYSVQGLKSAWYYEVAIRQEIIGTIILSTVAVFLPISYIEKAVLIACLLLVVIVELLNSAIEATVDRISAEMHELSGRAKDIGSAAVFITLLLATLIWAVVLVETFVV